MWDVARFCGFEHSAVNKDKLLAMRTRTNRISNFGPACRERDTVTRGISTGFLKARIYSHVPYASFFFAHIFTSQTCYKLHKHLLRVCTNSLYHPTLNSCVNRRIAYQNSTTDVYHLMFIPLLSHCYKKKKKKCQKVNRPFITHTHNTNLWSHKVTFAIVSQPE